jgi:hypothetical protein
MTTFAPIHIRVEEEYQESGFSRIIGVIRSDNEITALIDVLRWNSDFAMYSR